MNFNDRAKSYSNILRKLHRFMAKGETMNNNETQHLTLVNIFLNIPADVLPVYCQFKTCLEKVVL